MPAPLMSKPESSKLESISVPTKSMLLIRGLGNARGRRVLQDLSPDGVPGLGASKLPMSEIGDSSTSGACTPTSDAGDFSRAGSAQPWVGRTTGGFPEDVPGLGDSILSASRRTGDAPGNAGIGSSDERSSMIDRMSLVTKVVALDSRPFIRTDSRLCFALAQSREKAVLK